MVNAFLKQMLFFSLLTISEGNIMILFKKNNHDYWNWRWKWYCLFCPCNQL